MIIKRIIDPNTISIGTLKYDWLRYYNCQVYSTMYNQGISQDPSCLSFGQAVSCLDR